MVFIKTYISKILLFILSVLVFSAYGNNNNKCEEKLSKLGGGEERSYSNEEFRSLRRQARRGDVDAKALYDLGKIYWNGRVVKRVWGGKVVKQNNRKAFRLFERAAQQGSVEAQNMLGVMHEEGQAVKQSYENALYFYRPLAHQGYAVAQFNFGMMYLDGKGVKQDNSKAFYWLKKAALQGHYLGQHLLGIMYREGSGVMRDNEKAFYWLKKAAHQGVSTAQGVLGVMYKAGEGVERDYEKAFYWFKIAAEHEYGDISAFYHLGMMYANGIGVAGNKIQAYRWLFLYDSVKILISTEAESEGIWGVNENAEKRLSELANEMTVDQVDEAHRLINQIMVD